MARIDPSLGQKLFAPTTPRQDYSWEMPGIGDAPGFIEAGNFTKPKSPSLADIVMARYDTLVYPRLMKIFKEQLPHLDERDYNFMAIKNLARSKVVSAKDAYIPMVRDGAWELISDFLTLYVANTVINKYMRLKSNKMSENVTAYGLQQYSYGLSSKTGVFPVEGPLTEIPIEIDFSTEPPEFPYRFDAWAKPINL